jgi:LacI family transcriptional regulator
VWSGAEVATTAKQVAEAAGVDRSTVSKVVNGASGSTRVSPATAKRVLQVARELNYRPNAAARAARKGKFQAIGLVASTDRLRSAYGPYLQGINAACRQHDLHLTIGEVEDEKLTSREHIPRLLREWMVDGLLISYMWGFPAILQDVIDQARVPSIWMNAKQDHDCVHPDEIQGFTLATQSLIDHGHRRIMYVGSSDTSRHYSVGDRVRAYSETMRSAGLTPWLSHPNASAIYWVELFPQIQDWLRGEDRPTAILVTGKDAYAGVHHAATAVGLRVPEDLSIIVCHDAGTISFMGQRVSTLVLDAGAIGIQAVEMLREKIANPRRTFDPVAIPYSLERIGESVAAPPA